LDDASEAANESTTEEAKVEEDVSLDEEKTFDLSENKASGEGKRKQRYSLATQSLLQQAKSRLASIPPIETVSHALSEGLKLENITIYVKYGANLGGIGRFYECVIGAFVAHDSTTDSSITIVMGQNTLTFQYHPLNTDAAEDEIFIGDVSSLPETLKQDEHNYNSDSSYGGYEDEDDDFEKTIEDALIDTLEAGVEGVHKAVVAGKPALENGLEGALEGAVGAAAGIAAYGAKKVAEKMKGKPEGNSKSDSEVVYPPNYGPHISLFVTNLPRAYQMASNLGVQYVNTRFGRMAYTEEQVIEQSMFRFIDIVDPIDENDEREVIVRLEHKVRSTRTKDGKKYTTFPLDKMQRQMRAT